jgi:proline iminopeptidase
MLPAMESRVVKVDAGSAILHVSVAGSDGPLVVVPHPFQSMDANSSWLRAAIGGQAQCVTVHPRGAGESTGSDLSTETLVADLDLVRRTLAADEWIVWGQSGGGTVAMLFALAHPNATRALVLSCTTADGIDQESVYHPSNPDNATAAQALASGDRATLATLIAHRPGPVVARDDGGGQSQARRLVYFAERRADLLPMLSRLTKPALVIGGRYDRAIPIHHQELIAEALADAEFVVFESSGHFPYLEEPERFTEVMTTFLSRVI